MRYRLASIPSQALQAVSCRLEARIIAGDAEADEIDAFVAIESELGRRIASLGILPDSLDGVLDPRD